MFYKNNLAIRTGVTAGHYCKCYPAIADIKGALKDTLSQLDNCPSSRKDGWSDVMSNLTSALCIAKDTKQDCH